MTLRRMLFWLHLIAGLTVGSVIFLLAVTGSMLVFQPQIVGWAERDARILNPPLQNCVTPSVVLGNAASFEHAQPTQTVFFADMHRPAEISFGNGAVVLVERCDGKVIGPGANRLRAFFQATRDLHQRVAFNGVPHPILRQIKDAAVIVFLFLIVSGAVLWFPRRLTWQHLRPALFFRGKLQGRAREWNWHNVFGFWMCLPLAVIACTGIIMAYPWANAMLFRAAGSEPPPQRAEGDMRRPKPMAAEQFSLLDAAIKTALAQESNWTILTLRLPSAKDANATFTLDEGDGGRPQRRGELVVSRNDGQIVRWQPFSANPRGRQWRMYVRFLHTGELFGIASRIVAFLAALSAMVLVYTGFSLALRRFIAWRKRSSANGKAVREMPGVEPEPSCAIAE